MARKQIHELTAINRDDTGSWAASHYIVAAGAEAKHFLPF